MVTVTYRQLNPMDTDYPGVTTRIEAYTGSRQSYGLDMPINVLDIIDNVGLDDGILTLDYAVSNTLPLCQILAIECLRASMIPWETIFPGDSRLRDFLHDAELYLETKDTPGTPKVDYCGDEIPGFYGTIPVNQLTDQYNSIKASSDALSLVGTFYMNSSWLTSGGPFSQAAIEYLENSATGRWTIDLQDRNSVDYVTIPATALTGYTTQNINSILATDPDYYFKESAQFDVQIVPSYTHYGIIFHRILNGIFVSATLDEQISYEHLAVQMLVDQLAQLFMMLVYDVNLLPSIIVGIKSYMLQYETELRLKLGASMPRLQALKTDGSFANKTHDPTVDAAEQTILNAGLNRRAELLRNPIYVRTFDTNLSGTLTAAERAALENGVRAEMKIAREGAANTLFNAAEVEYNALTQLSSNQRLIDIITPYLL